MADPDIRLGDNSICFPVFHVHFLLEGVKSIAKLDGEAMVGVSVPGSPTATFNVARLLKW